MDGGIDGGTYILLKEIFFWSKTSKTSECCHFVLSTFMNRNAVGTNRCNETYTVFNMCLRTPRCERQCEVLVPVGWGLSLDPQRGQ